MTNTVDVPENAKGLVVERADMELSELCKNTEVPNSTIQEIESAIQTVEDADSSAVPKKELKLVVERATIEYQELHDYSDVSEKVLEELGNAIDTVENCI